MKLLQFLYLLLDVQLERFALGARVRGQIVRAAELRLGLERQAAIVLLIFVVLEDEDRRLVVLDRLGLLGELAGQALVMFAHLR